MQEIWKAIKGWEGSYEVSNFGRIRSLDRVIVTNRKGVKNTRQVNERILRHGYSPIGYPIVFLCRNCERVKKYVHRLVAETFLDNNNNFPEVNHIDGDKKNCHLSNLEWVTRSENKIHSHRVLGQRPAVKAIKCVETGERFRSCTDASKKTGVSIQAISTAAKGGKIVGGRWKNKYTAAGYHWEFINN